MSIKLVNTYLTSRNGNISLLNLNIRQYLTEDDYTEVTINDFYKFRLDIQSSDYIGDPEYYFFIMFINNITSLDDISPGKILKIPTNNFIEKYRDIVRIERGV